MYQEAGKLVERFGTLPCLILIPDPTAYRHASTEGRTVMETEPLGKAAQEVRDLFK